MSQYFYAVSTLSLLEFSQEQVPEAAEFLDMCRRELTPPELELLQQAVLVPGGEPTAVGLEYETLLDAAEVVTAWLNWESRLRDELVRLRAQKIEIDGSSYISDAAYVTGVHDVAREAISAASPLEAEEILDRARWRYLDELEAGHFFDLSKLIIYYVRLQILERRSLFRGDRGEKRFGELYSSVMPESFSEEFGQNNAESE